MPLLIRYLAHQTRPATEDQVSRRISKRVGRIERREAESRESESACVEVLVQPVRHVPGAFDRSAGVCRIVVSPLDDRGAVRVDHGERSSRLPDGGG